MTVEERVKNIAHGRTLASKAYREANDFLDSLLKEVQADCHHEWKHHPDPSGNNDSWDECAHCGKEEG